MTSRQQKLHDMSYQQDDSECWIWKGQISNSGYGRIMEVQDDRRTKMVLSLIHISEPTRRH